MLPRGAHGEVSLSRNGGWSRIWSRAKAEIENSRYRPEAFMAITGNVPRIERVIRTVLAVTLILLGVSLTGFWKPLSIIAGVFLVFTAFVGY